MGILCCQLESLTLLLDVMVMLTLQARYCTLFTYLGHCPASSVLSTLLLKYAFVNFIRKILFVFNPSVPERGM